MKKIIAFVFTSIIMVGAYAQSYTITSYGFTPASPAQVALGQNISCTFSATKPEGDCRIYVTPLHMGSYFNGVGASGSPVYSGSSVTGSTVFNYNAPGHADQVEFKFVDAVTFAEISRVVVPVDFTWGDFNISDVTFNPASPANVPVNRPVSVSFSYTKPDGDVRIQMIPRTFTGFGGSPFIISDPILLTENSGTVTMSFNKDASGNSSHVQIKMMGVASNTIIYEEYFPADFNYIDYEASNYRPVPAPPVTLAPNQPVTLTADYTKPQGPVLVFLRGCLDNAVVANSQSSSSEVINDLSGTFTRSFTLTGEGRVEKISIIFTSVEEPHTILAERFLWGDFVFSGSSGVNSDDLPDRFILFPSPCTDQVTISNPQTTTFEYRIFNLQGDLLLNGRSNSSAVRVGMGSLASGIYLVRILHTGGLSNRILIKE